MSQMGQRNFLNSTTYPMETEVNTIDDFEINVDHHVSVLGLSTVHFNPLTDERALRNMSTMDGHVGYLVHVGGQHGSSVLLGEDITDGLKITLETARKAGYDYILFDRDASEHPSLPTFEEEWERAQGNRIPSDRKQTVN